MVVNTCMNATIAKMLVEMIGTFLLCFTIATAEQEAPLKPLAIGATLMCTIYGGGHISGAHYNPVRAQCTSGARRMRARACATTPPRKFCPRTSHGQAPSLQLKHAAPHAHTRTTHGGHL